MRKVIHQKASGQIYNIIVAAIIVAFAFSFLPECAHAAKKAFAPAKVKNVKIVKKTQNSVTIKWDKAKRAKQYQVWQLKNKKYKKIKTTKKRKITIKGLSPGKSYKCKIRGIKGKGKGKFTFVKFKTKFPAKKSAAPVVKPPVKDSSPAASNSTNAPAVAQEFNLDPGMFEEKNDLNITVKASGCVYDYEYNVNRFDFSISTDDNTKNLTLNATDITPKKVKNFFGKFYKPGAKPIKRIKTETRKKNNGKEYVAVNVYTDPFVSDVYFYATDTSGKVVYGTKLGWDYGLSKHDYYHAMFNWAKPQNDVFQRMYDDARSKIVAKIKKEGGTYREQFIRYIKYIGNCVLISTNGTYNMTDEDKWVPGYVTYQTGLDMYENSQYQNWNVHDESSKLYYASSNFKYMAILGLEQFDCQSAHDVIMDDLIRDIDKNAVIKHNIRYESYVNNHVDTEIESFSDGSLGLTDSLTYPDNHNQATTAPGSWDYKLKNNETCRQNFKELVPNWQEWDIL